jgi:AbrB family looped-hinge helix DNA binding protein
MSVATLTTKGQIVIPVKIREELSIDVGTKINIEIVDGKIVMSLIDIQSKLSKFRKKVRTNLKTNKKVKISDEEINLAKANLWKQRQN